MSKAKKVAETRSPAIASAKQGRRMRILVYVVVPLLALILAAGAVYTYVTYLYIPHRNDTARTESVQAAKDGTEKLLSYKPETVRQQLTDARSLTTGAFRNEYTETTQSVIPGAEKNHVSAVTSVPAAASESVTSDHAVVLVFINQTVVVGDQAPTNTPTSVRVTLEREGGKWLISGFQTI
jgi:Mce-associated membrane protein